MTKLNRLVAVAVAVSALLNICCCGQPSEAEVRGWLANLPAGSSGEDAATLLKRKGLHVDRGRLAGNPGVNRVIASTDACATDSVEAIVYSDEHDRITEINVVRNSSLP